eukprot:NODE_910_length_3155_cov_0.267343.p4 type:complete len:114 gc:universal NODE_910_length_3155_cov_0.267343:977-636(-)
MSNFFANSSITGSKSFTLGFPLESTDSELLESLFSRSLSLTCPVNLDSSDPISESTSGTATFGTAGGASAGCISESCITFAFSSISAGVKKDLSVCKSSVLDSADTFSTRLST